MVKNPPVIQKPWVPSLGWEDPLEIGKATHFSILAWRISWTEEPGRLQSLGLQRVGHDWATKHSIQCLPQKWIQFISSTNHNMPKHICYFNPHWTRDFSCKLFALITLLCIENNKAFSKNIPNHDKKILRLGYQNNSLNILFFSSHCLSVSKYYWFFCQPSIISPHFNNSPLLKQFRKAFSWFEPLSFTVTFTKLKKIFIF